MSDEKGFKQAQDVFKALCTMLDEHDWHYEKNAEKLMVKCGAQGEDLPMELIVRVDADRRLITLVSAMPFIIPENRRSALAVAVSKANYGLPDGSFDYEYTSGKIWFRMTSSYIESLIGKDLFEYMLMCSCFFIDKYNDKFLKVVLSEMTVNEILNFIE